VRLNFTCLQCPPDVGSKPVSVEIEDHGLYAFGCPAGHRSVHQLGNPKFEILFDIGLLAFADGYTREAVATFAAAVEEFFRLFVTTVFAKRQMGDDPALPKLDPFWKLANRAEPQLGAFAAAYMFEKGHAPEFPDQKSTEFRNNVIHRGRIPKSAEVVEYAEKILGFVVPLYTEFWGSTPMLLATAYQSRKERRGLTDQPTAVYFYGSSIHNLITRSGTPTFQQALQFATTQSFLQPAAT